MVTLGRRVDQMWLGSFLRDANLAGTTKMVSN